MRCDRARVANGVAVSIERGSRAVSQIANYHELGSLYEWLVHLRNARIKSALFERNDPAIKPFGVFVRRI